MANEVNSRRISEPILYRIALQRGEKVDKPVFGYWRYPQFCSKTHVFYVDKVDNWRKKRCKREKNVDNNVNEYNGTEDMRTCVSE